MATMARNRPSEWRSSRRLFFRQALGVLFNPETAVSCETMKIQEWDAALYKTKEHCYLCWTYSPEVSYVLEYNPEAVSDDEIIMMAESAEPYEEK